MLIYLFILVAIFICNLLLYFTYFSDDYIYYHFIVYWQLWALYDSPMFLLLSFFVWLKKISHF